jgi:FkbM family methyltransferase
MINPRFARQIIRNYGFERTKIFRSKLRRILNSFLDPVQDVEVVRGLRLRLDMEIDRQNFVFWHYEEEEPQLQWVIRNLLPVRGTMVDCGANFGVFGMLALHHRAANVHFIEPHPRLAETCRQQIALNFYGSRAKVHEVAASSAEGEARFYLNPGRNDGTHSLEATPGQKRDFILVKRQRLDALLAQQGVQHVDLMKIDAEGHDYEVLEGMGNWIDPAKIDCFFVEMAHGTHQKVFDLLSSRGYVPYASKRMYIDEMRKEYRSGNLSPYFSRATDANGMNYLWCGKDSVYDQFMAQVVQYQPAQKGVS